MFSRSFDRESLEIARIPGYCQIQTVIKTYLGPAQLCSRRQTQGGQRGDEPRLHKQQISQVPQISSTEIYITIITF